MGARRTEGWRGAGGLLKKVHKQNTRQTAGDGRRGTNSGEQLAAGNWQLALVRTGNSRRR